MQWYYERDGQQVGPVSQAEMVRLVVHRHIQPQTLVWHPSLGDQWLPARKAGLVLPSGGMKIIFAPGMEPKDVVGKAGGQVTSLWAWLLLLVPSLIDAGLQIAGHLTKGAVSPSLATLLCLYGIMFLTITKDRRALLMGGVKPPSFWWWLFLPGYFWCRRANLRKGMALFVGSILVIVLRAVVFFADPPPGFPSLSQSPSGRVVSSASKETSAPSSEAGGVAPKTSTNAAGDDKQVQL